MSATPPPSPVAVASGCVGRRADVAGYRWLRGLQRMNPMCGFNVELVYHLWCLVNPQLCCCLACADGYWCLNGLDYWMTWITIYVIKFYGSNFGAEDREYIQWLKGNYFDNVVDHVADAEEEINIINLLAPFAVSLREIPEELSTVEALMTLQDNLRN